jgi:hypothetical protein
LSGNGGTELNLEDNIQIFSTSGGISSQGVWQHSNGRFSSSSGFGTVSSNGNITADGNISTDGSLTRTLMAGSTTRYANVTSSGAIVAGANVPSDERLKENISDLSIGLDFIKSVRPVEFEFIDKNNPHNQGVQFGVIAQQLVEALGSNGISGDNGLVYIPELPEEDMDPNQYYMVNHEQMISPLIKAVQELTARIEALEAKVQ